MNRKFIPDSEYKLLILYTLNKLGPVTDEQLLRYMVEYDLINYFDLQLNLADLYEHQQLIRNGHPLGLLITLTENALETLTAFELRIPASRRKLIDDTFSSWQLHFFMEQSTLAESFRLKNNNNCIRLRLLEQDTALLDLLLETNDNPPMLINLQKRWHICAQPIYNAITQALATGYNHDAPPASLPEGTTVDQVRCDEYLLSLQLGSIPYSITLMLMLPDRVMAHWYAHNWPTHADELRSTIITLMNQALPSNAY